MQQHIFLSAAAAGLARCPAPSRTGRSHPAGGRWARGRGGAAGQMCSDKFQLLAGRGCVHTCASAFFLRRGDLGTVNILILQPTQPLARQSYKVDVNLCLLNLSGELKLQNFHLQIFFVQYPFFAILISTPSF